MPKEEIKIGYLLRIVIYDKKPTGTSYNQFEYIHSGLEVKVPHDKLTGLPRPGIVAVVVEEQIPRIHLEESVNQTYALFKLSPEQEKKERRRASEKRAEQQETAEKAMKLGLEKILTTREGRADQFYVQQVAKSLLIEDVANEMVNANDKN